jgi:hypothetical protein
MQHCKTRFTMLLLLAGKIINIGVDMLQLCI